MDSNTNYVPVRELFNIRKFYDKNYTEYCASFGPKIVLLFDLLAGTAYESAMDMKMVDDDTVQFTGSATSVLSMYDRLINSEDIAVECNMNREDIIPNSIDDPVLRFIKEKGTCIRMDKSEYTVQFRRAA